MLRLQRLVKVVDGPLPSELGGGFVETRRRVVMEAMIRFWIDICLIPDAIGLESGFVIGPPAVDVGILLGKVKQQRGLDLWHVRSCRRGAVERYAGRELRQPDRQLINHTATEAKAHGAKLVDCGCFSRNSAAARKSSVIFALSSCFCIARAFSSA